LGGREGPYPLLKSLSSIENCDNAMAKLEEIVGTALLHGGFS